jgi:hypothetical protein
MSITALQVYEIAKFMSCCDVDEDMCRWYLNDETSCVGFIVKENTLRWCGEFGMLMARSLGKVKFPIVREDGHARAIYFPQIPFSEEEEKELFPEDNGEDLEEEDK